MIYNVRTSYKYIFLIFLLLAKLEQNGREETEVETIQNGNPAVTKDIKDLIDKLLEVTEERVDLQWLITDLSIKITELAEDKNVARMEEGGTNVPKAEKNSSEEVEIERANNTQELKVKSRISMIQAVSGG